MACDEARESREFRWAYELGTASPGALPVERYVRAATRDHAIRLVEEDARAYAATSCSKAVAYRLLWCECEHISLSEARRAGAATQRDGPLGVSEWVWVK